MREERREIFFSLTIKRKEIIVEEQAVDINLANTAVGSTLEDIGVTGNTTPEIKLGGQKRILFVEIENLGATNALTDFAILVKAHKDATWTLLLSSTDWATIATILMYFKGAPHTLATTSIAHVQVDVRGMHAVKFQAKSTASSVTIKGKVW